MFGGGQPLLRTEIWDQTDCVERNPRFFYLFLLVVTQWYHLAK